MSEDKNTVPKELSFREKARQLTEANVVKGRRSRTGTYLAAFVALLIKKNENTALNRVEIISEISADIIEATYKEEGVDFENPEHVEAFAGINKKVKAQVAAAVSNSQNNTSMSYNPDYKDKYTLNKSKGSKGEVFWITENDAGAIV